MQGLPALGLALVVVATSFLSGIFGMAGGLILLGALLAVLDVAPAMVLFGTTQLAANGWRGALWRAHVRWDIVGRYGIGSIAAFIVMKFVVFLPSKALVYFGLGLMPFAVDLLPRRFAPDIAKPGAPFVCGTIVMVLQLLAGAGVLAIFGTTLAARVLHRMTDAGFRAWSRKIIEAVSAFYALRGAWLLAIGG